ncbi:MAG: YhfC family intramembrane metalloprotease [Chloroflexi bacterium]|nr:MAG: YhfC family intramembrane metalloprotease [Chloroflexota bacterium]
MDKGTSMKRFLACLILCVPLFLLSGCAQAITPTDLHWASVEGGQIEKTEPGEEFYFTVMVDQAGLKPEPIPVHIQVSGLVNSGSLRFELRDPDGQAVWNTGEIGPGDFSITTDYIPDRGNTGEYHLGLVYPGGTSAFYNLAWHALRLSPLVLVPGIGMLLVSLAFIVYGARRYSWGRLDWRYFGLGALFWIFTVAVKFAWAIPVNPPIYQALNVSKDTLFAPGNLVAYVYIGALTGIFEVGLAWLVLRKTRWARATWQQALAFGIGFGVVEALLLGLASFGSGMAGLVAPDAIPTYSLASLVRSGTLLMAPAPVAERLFVILAHIFACALIFYAITNGQVRWVVLAILYKTILDIPGGFAAFWGVDSPEKLWTIEAIVAVTGLVGLWGTWWIAKRYPRAD